MPISAQVSATRRKTRTRRRYRFQSPLLVTRVPRKKRRGLFGRKRSATRRKTSFDRRHPHIAEIRGAYRGVRRLGSRMATATHAPLRKVAMWGTESIYVVPELPVERRTGRGKGTATAAPGTRATSQQRPQRQVSGAAGTEYIQLADGKLAGSRTVGRDGTVRGAAPGRRSSMPKSTPAPRPGTDPGWDKLAGSLADGIDPTYRKRAAAAKRADRKPRPAGPGTPSAAPRNHVRASDAPDLAEGVHSVDGAEYRVTRLRSRRGPDRDQMIISRTERDGLLYPLRDAEFDAALGKLRKKN